MLRFDMLNNPLATRRRPALIPEGVHLSAEDLESVILRIGNLSLALLDTPPSDQTQEFASIQPICDCEHHSLSLGQQHYQLAATKKTGTKRKASTAAAQFKDLSVSGDEMDRNSREEDRTVTTDEAKDQPLTRIPQHRNCQHAVSRKDTESWSFKQVGKPA